MPEQKDIECEYFLKDDLSCIMVKKGEGKQVRKESCRHKTDVCCYRCNDRNECEVSCVFLDRHTPDERASDMRPVVPPEISNVMILEEDEKILRSWNGTAEGVYNVVVEKGEYIKRPAVAEVKRKSNGVLVVTNKRLVWVASRGVLTTSHHVSLEIPLERIRGISEGGTFSKYVSVIHEKGEHRFFLVFGTSSGIPPLEQFSLIVEPAIQARKKEIEKEKRKEKVQVTIEFSALEDFLSKGGLKLDAIKCPVCGGKLKLPDRGGTTTCEHCGNDIYAQDIFQKIRDLLI